MKQYTALGDAPRRSLAADARSAIHTAAFVMFLGCITLPLIGISGCTAESTRLALRTQRRADDVQQALFDRQHEGLRALLYRDLTHKLEQSGPPLNAEQRVALNDAWNERDLLEFWAIQQERARALRLAGVDAKLFADQSIVDLLIKSIEAKADRAKEGIASIAGASVAAPGDTGAESQKENRR